jgi:hypothetical protein
LEGLDANEIRYVGYSGRSGCGTAFYNDQWKLVEAGEKDGMVHFAAEGDDELYVVRLRRNEDKRIDVSRWPPTAAPMLTPCMRRPRRRVAGSFSRQRNWRRWAVAMASTSSPPTACRSRFQATSPAGPPRELARWEGVRAKISRIVLHSPDHQKLVQWLCDVLGFKVSDWLGDFMCFLRCNSAHRRIVILPGRPASIMLPMTC